MYSLQDYHFRLTGCYHGNKIYVHSNICKKCTAIEDLAFSVWYNEFYNTIENLKDMPEQSRTNKGNQQTHQIHYCVWGGYKGATCQRLISYFVVTLSWRRSWQLQTKFFSAQQLFSDQWNCLTQCSHWLRDMPLWLWDWKIGTGTKGENLSFLQSIASAALCLGLAVNLHSWKWYCTATLFRNKTDDRSTKSL